METGSVGRGEDPDPAERLGKIAKHVVDACYLAHEARAELLAHILKMALSELENLGAFR